MATWCEELTYWKRPWCWERLKVSGLGDDRGWDGWMASPTQWTWVWVSSVSWWWTGNPGMLQSMGSQRVGHNWATELMPIVYQLSQQGSPTHTQKNLFLKTILMKNVVKLCNAFSATIVFVWFSVYELLMWWVICRFLVLKYSCLGNPVDRGAW